MGTSVNSKDFNPVENGGRPIPPGFEAWTVAWAVQSETYLVYREQYPLSLSSLFVNYFVSFSVSVTAYSISLDVFSRLFYWVAQRRLKRREAAKQVPLYQELLPVGGVENEV